MMEERRMNQTHPVARRENDESVWVPRYKVVDLPSRGRVPIANRRAVSQLLVEGRAWFWFKAPVLFRESVE